MPFVCYVDEAGCTGELPAARTDIQPVLIVAGLVLPQSRIAQVTVDFLKLKRKYFPGKFTSGHPLDDVRVEIKGSDIRSTIRKRTAHAKAELCFLDDILEMLKANDARYCASVWVKGIGKKFDGRAIYTRSLQHTCNDFQGFLLERDDVGLVVADNRSPGLNDQVAHSIFTQKYRARGDPLCRILELPTFGVSNNHVGLQITDVLCSTLLFPMATASYCWGYVKGKLVHPQHMFIKRRYASRLRTMQLRYTDGHGTKRWCVWVSDALADRDSRALFEFPTSTPGLSIPALPVALPGVEARISPA